MNLITLSAFLDSLSSITLKILLVIVIIIFLIISFLVFTKLFHKKKQIKVFMSPKEYKNKFQTHIPNANIEDTSANKEKDTGIQIKNQKNWL